MGYCCRGRGGGKEWRAHHDQPERGWLWPGGKGTGVAGHESCVCLLCNRHIHLLRPACFRSEEETVRKSAVGRGFLKQMHQVLRKVPVLCLWANSTSPPRLQAVLRHSSYSVE